ncbi:hypothetical protein D9M72_220520 [compost metagenome]
MLGQVGVFHRANAHGTGDLAQLGFVQVGVLALHQVIGALFGLVQQVDQLHRAAVAGLEGLAIGAVHGAEAHVLHFEGRRHEAGQARGGEHHLEVQGLALVDEVQRAVGLEHIGAVAGGGQVGGGVEVTTAGLLHDQRQRVAFGVLELVHEHAQGAVAFGEQALGAQVGDDVGQVVVVGAFALHVGHAELHAQAVVHRLAVAQGNVVEAGPEFQALGVAGLQLDHQLAGAVGELGGFVEALLRGAIEGFQVGQLGVAAYRLFLHIGQQHTELGAPVAHVVLADHGVAEELQYAGHAVTDDGGTQVADVHFLGQVRCRQVDDHALLRAVLAHAEVGVGQCGVQALGQGLAVLEEVEEAGAGDFHLGHLLVPGQGGDELFGQVARLHAGGFGQHHGDVAGEVAVALVLGVFHLDGRAEPLGQHALAGETGQGLLDQLANGVFHLLLFRPPRRGLALVENCALSAGCGCSFKF